MKIWRSAGGPPLQQARIPVQARLAALWAGLMFIYIYVDILSLYRPGVIDGIRAGRVWQLDITQSWAVGALALMAVPILMGVLSLTLPARANRTTNLVVAALYAVVSVVNGMGETWAYYFALAVSLEVIVLALIVWYAWTWPRSQPLADGPDQREDLHQLISH